MVQLDAVGASLWRRPRASATQFIWQSSVVSDGFSKSIIPEYPYVMRKT